MSLSARFSAARQMAEEIARQISDDTAKPFKQHFDERQMSVILASMFPDRYPIYKNDIYQLLLEQVSGDKPALAGLKYEHYSQLAEQFRDTISRDKELQSLIDERIDGHPFNWGILPYSYSKICLCG